MFMKIVVFLFLVGQVSSIFTRQRFNVNISILSHEAEYDGLTSVAIEHALNVIRTKTKFNFINIAEHDPIPKRGLFEAGQKVCESVNQGTAALFGPAHDQINEIVQSISTSLEIPHFQMMFNPRPLRNHNAPIFNLYPSARDLSYALATLVRDNDWQTFTVIYEDEHGLVRLQESLKEIKPRMPSDVAVTFRKLEPGYNYRSVLKQIKNSENYNFIVDCKADRILEFLRQAKEQKLLEEYHSYLLTDMDAHTLKWSSLKPFTSNITTFRMVDPEGSTVQEVAKLWRVNPKEIKTETALIYDALNLFATAVRDKFPHELPNEKLDCLGFEVASHGELIRTAISKPSKKSKPPVLSGFLSGPLQFDRHGVRKNVNLQIVELKKTEPGFRVTGSWTSANPQKISYVVTSAEREKEIETELQKRNFRVVSKLGAPYFMLREDVNKETYGNDQYEGYAVDLIKEICNFLNCSYTFEVVPDGKYGNYDLEKKEWNGLIRHLLDRKADLAVADLTITYERKTAVDFTNPFMNLGISILYAKAVKEPPELLSFALPLSLDVWLYMATSYLIISIIIFLVARLNPNDWENPHPCDPEPKELENIWTIRNCVWLTLGSIMTQGCDLLPKGISTRMATASWWFFSLIMTSSYTANMAAFLTMSRMELTIDSAEDLANQNKIKYGCLQGGSTCSFFKDTNFSIYHQMWLQMESADPSVFELSNADGVKRVQTSKRKYAFLMESTNIQYVTERYCDLIQVGSEIDSKGYGIAMTANFQYRKPLNAAILKLQESGALDHLKKKWWKQMHGGGICEAEVTSGNEAAAELGLDNVGGVFVVLAVGVGLGLIFSLCEFTWMVKKVAVREHIAFKHALIQELTFAFNIWERQKKVQ